MTDKFGNKCQKNVYISTMGNGSCNKDTYPCTRCGNACRKSVHIMTSNHEIHDVNKHNNTSKLHYCKYCGGVVKNIKVHELYGPHYAGQYKIQSQSE